MTGSTLTIGALARAAGVNVETVRYYQRIGLLETPPRPARGYRRYPHSAVRRLRFVRRAQALGFSLREIAELLSLNDGDCGEARVLAQRKLESVERRMADLARLRARLADMVEACRHNAGSHGCPLIGSLSDPDTPS